MINIEKIATYQIYTESGSVIRGNEFGNRTQNKKLMTENLFLR